MNQIDERKYRLLQAARVWSELSNEQRAKATALFLMRNAQCAMAADLILDGGECETTQLCMEVWADDFERTFGVPAPWRLLATL